MKKHFTKAFVVFILSVFILTPSKSYSQDGDLEIFGMGGYMLGGSMKFYEGKLKTMDNANYGGGINYLMANDNRIEISFSHMETTYEFYPNTYLTDIGRWSGKGSVTYVQIGSQQEFGVSDKVIPFGGLSLGATIFTLKEAGVSDYWRFSVTLGGGLKILVSEKVGIRMQARLLMPMFYAGAGFGCGIGTGGTSCGMSLNAGTVMLQGDFMGGLFLRI